MDHLVTSYAVLTWWYTPKGKGGANVHAPRGALFVGYSHGFSYHFGSLVYGSLLTPYTRIPRVLSSVVFNQEHGVGCCVSLGSWLKEHLCSCCAPSEKYNLYSKDSFNDVIIRSNNYDHGCLRVHQVFESTEVCSKNRRRLGSITHGGVLSIGIASAMILYWIITTDSSYTDPASGWYITEPIVILILAAWLCAWVGYTFCMLLEHTADMLLYCYAWNKKVKKATVDDHIPDALTLVVGFEHKHTDGYPMYGKANPKMYLGTFMDTKAKPAQKPPPLASQDQGGLGVNQSYQTGGCGGYPPQGH